MAPSALTVKNGLLQLEIMDWFCLPESDTVWFSLDESNVWFVLNGNNYLVWLSWSFYMNLAGTEFPLVNNRLYCAIVCLR